MASKFTSNTARVIQHERHVTAGGVAHHARLSLDLAQSYCPVLTGRLRDSGRIRQINALRWEGSFNTAYAAIVEFGGRGRAARYFVTRAVSESRRAALEEFRRLGG